MSEISVEAFLRGLNPVNIVGGSPLYSGLPEFAISINGLRAGAYAAAINSTRSNARRTKDWERVLLPNPQRPAAPHEMTPQGFYLPPAGMMLPTTCFSLLLICQALGLPVELYGVCGWASEYHDGDWEMYYIKRNMPNVTVHDPRPQW